MYVGRLRSGEDVAIKVQKPGVEDTLKVSTTITVIIMMIIHAWTLVDGPLL